MEWHIVSYTVPLWINLIFSILISVYIFKRRYVNGAMYLFIMCLIMGLWSFGYIFELLSQDTEQKILWDNIQMLGGAMGSSCLAFALQYTKSKVAFNRKVFVVLAIEPVIVWCLATFNIGNLFRKNIGIYEYKGIKMLLYDMGVLSLVDAIFGYIMYGLFIILIIRFFLKFRTLYAKQVMVIGIGVTVVALGYILYFLGLTPNYMKDPSPFTFAILNILLLFSIYYYRFLSIAPIGREVIFENINEGLVVLDNQNIVSDINAQAKKILNCNKRRVVGKHVDIAFPEIGTTLKKIDDSTDKKIEFFYNKHTYEIEFISLFNKNDFKLGCIIAIYDISERKKLEKSLQQREEKYRNACEYANDGIAIIQDGIIRYANKKLINMIQYSYDEIIDHFFENYVLEQYRSKLIQKYIKRLKNEKIDERYEAVLLCKNGEKLDVEVNAALMNYNGRPAIVAHIRDITEYKLTKSTLQELASKDPLTKVLNRRHFFALAQKEFNRSIKEKKSMVAIMIDVDYFKKINDTYGHSIGDEVLFSVANIIQSCIRNSDVLGRYGGEEFCAFLPETDFDKAKVIAERIREKIMISQIETEKGKISITISLGIARKLENSEDTVNKMFNRADEALYNAKRIGRNKVVVYNKNK